MGFWVAEWVPSPKENLLGKLPGGREGDVRGPPAWVLPVLLVLLPGDCRLPVGLRKTGTTSSVVKGTIPLLTYLPDLKESLTHPENAPWAWAGGVVPWIPL